jgi:hypothetical protein
LNGRRALSDGSRDLFSSSVIVAKHYDMKVVGNVLDVEGSAVGDVMVYDGGEHGVGIARD